MCLAQGQNTVTRVRLEPAAPRSQVKHSTTEPLCSSCIEMISVKFSKPRSYTFGISPESLKYILCKFKGHNSDNVDTIVMTISVCFMRLGVNHKI